MQLLLQDLPYGRVSAPSIRSAYLRIAVMVGIIPLFMTTAKGNDWPQWMGGPQNNGSWSEEGILTKFPASGLAVKWRTPIGHGYSGPSVANGSVFVMDLQNSDPSNTSERVLCLDAANGNIRWQYAY